jgi:hypothetical protein
MVMEPGVLMWTFSRLGKSPVKVFCPESMLPELDPSQIIITRRSTNHNLQLKEGLGFTMVMASKSL